MSRIEGAGLPTNVSVTNMSRGWWNFKEHERENLNCLKQTVSRNFGIEDVAGEV